MPKRLLSRTVGILMRLPQPRVLARLLIPAFARFFNIDQEEAERSPAEYKSFDDYFTRKLKPGVRPIAQSLIVHPVDGRLTEMGVVEQGRLLQAKGWTYELPEFLGDKDLALAYEKGHFCTYYLCPTDYHRVHAPSAGDLVSARHIPGLLWPVNEWSVSHIQRLFNLNERVVLNFKSPQGRWSLVMVGATNVGQMTVSLDPSITTNRWMWHAPTDRQYSPPMPVAAGDELGIFHLGSTVVCVFEQSFGRLFGSSRAVRMGRDFFA